MSSMYDLDYGNRVSMFIDLELCNLTFCFVSYIHRILQINLPDFFSDEICRGMCVIFLKENLPGFKCYKKIFP